MLAIINSNLSRFVNLFKKGIQVYNRVIIFHANMKAKKRKSISFLSNIHKRLKDKKVSLSTMILGSSGLGVLIVGNMGVFGVIKSWNDSNSPTPTTVSTPIQISSGTSQKTGFICSLEIGIKRVNVIKDEPALRKTDIKKDDNFITRLKPQDKLILLGFNQKGTWLRVCLEETDVKGWVHSDYISK